MKLDKKTLALMMLLTFGGAAAAQTSNDNADKDIKGKKALALGKANTGTTGSFTVVAGGDGDPSEPRTLQEAASLHTSANAELGILVKYGPENGEAFHNFMDRLSTKLDEKHIPHKFFMGETKTPGVAFAYFVDGKQHGPFNLKEFVAMLPEAERDFRDVHPTVTASAKAIGSVGASSTQQVATIDY